MSGYPLLEVGTPPPYSEQVIWSRRPDTKTRHVKIEKIKYKPKSQPLPYEEALKQKAGTVGKSEAYIKPQRKVYRPLLSHNYIDLRSKFLIPPYYLKYNEV